VNIHHPLGDVMKISFAGAATKWTSDDSHQYRMWEAVYNKGTSQEKSSGSVLLNQNKYAVGVLHGGDGQDLPRCTSSTTSTGTGRFIRLGYYWRSFAGVLDPNHTGAVQAPGRNGSGTLFGSYIYPSLSKTTSTLCYGQNGYVTINNFAEFMSGNTSWSVSPSNLVYTETQEGGKKLKIWPRTSSSKGNITVMATIDYGAFNKTYSTTLYVGKPSFSNPTVDGTTYYPGSSHGVCPGFHQARVTINGASMDNVSWTLNPPGAVSWSWDQYSSQITFETLPYYTQYPFSFNGTASNSCGSAQITFTFIYGPNCQFLLSPNPVDDELTITRLNQGDSLEKADNVEVVLFNNSKEIVYSLQSDEYVIKIPVKNLPQGNYIIHIIYKEGVLREQIVIKR
jgi:hypothetical protein